MEKLTPQQALQNLYVAARSAKLTADEHTLLGKCAEVLNELVSKKDEPKTEK